MAPGLLLPAGHDIRRLHFTPKSNAENEPRLRRTSMGVSSHDAASNHQSLLVLNTPYLPPRAFSISFSVPHALPFPASYLFIYYAEAARHVTEKHHETYTNDTHAKQ